MKALYERDPRTGVYHPLSLTEDAFDGRDVRPTQHPSAPAALLGALLEDAFARPGTRISHLSLDFFRAVPFAPMTLACAIARRGKTIEVSDGSLEVDGARLLRASAWRVNEVDHGRSDVRLHSPERPRSRDFARTFFPAAPDFGFVHAHDWRLDDAFAGTPTASHGVVAADDRGRARDESLGARTRACDGRSSESRERVDRRGRRIPTLEPHGVVVA